LVLTLSILRFYVSEIQSLQTLLFSLEAPRGEIITTYLYIFMNISPPTNLLGVHRRISCTRLPSPAIVPSPPLPCAWLNVRAARSMPMSLCHVLFIKLLEIFSYVVVN
jgi:hypothetical protein